MVAREPLRRARSIRERVEESRATTAGSTTDRASLRDACGPSRPPIALPKTEQHLYYFATSSVVTWERSATAMSKVCPAVSCVLVQVDGEEFNVIEPKEVDRSEVLTTSEAMRHWVVWAARFVAEFDEFHLAFRFVGPGKRRLWAILMSFQRQLRRVQIEQVACGSCKCMALIANPTHADLFVGSPTTKVSLDAAWDLPGVPCPTCGCDIGRKAIWAASFAVVNPDLLSPSAHP